MQDFVSMYKDDRYYNLEARAFHKFDELLQKAVEQPTSEEGRKVLKYLEDWKILDAFDPRSRKRKEKELECVRLYLSEESTDIFTRLKAMFAHYGVNVTEKTKGQCSSDNMVTAEHDGVPYALDPRTCYGGVDPTDVPHAAKHYKMSIKRHHKTIKAVYEFLKQNHSEKLGDIWVMMGGGSQLQAFYGNETGYLAILYLDMEDLEEQEKLSESGYLAACGAESFTLDVQWSKNNKYFKGIDIAGVTLQKG